MASPTCSASSNSNSNISFYTANSGSQNSDTFYPANIGRARKRQRRDFDSSNSSGSDYHITARSQKRLGLSGGQSTERPFPEPSERLVERITEKVSLVRSSFPDLNILGQPREYEERSGFPDNEPAELAQPNDIPNPPIPGDPAPDIQTLQARVNSFAKAHGFAVVRSQTSSQRRQKQRCTLECDRYGNPRPSEGSGIRKRRSRKTGCKWKILAESLPDTNGQWVLREHPKPEHHQHNHPPSISSAAHPIHRKRTGTVNAAIESASRRVGIRARDVRGIVQEHHPEAVLTARDIYNARASIIRGKIGGYTSTAALIKQFDEQDIPYAAKWAEDEPDRLVGLVWTFPYCIRMWKRFPEVLSFDNTYNTNRFKLPLFQVTGQTCLKTVYNAAFGLIDNERLEGFDFLTSQVRQLVERYEIRLPGVVITDFDRQLKIALSVSFPDSQQQLCIHHINSAVLLKAKRKWVDNDDEKSSSDSDDLFQLSEDDQEAIRRSSAQSATNAPSDIPYNYQGVLVLWRLVVFAETEEKHEKAWANLVNKFENQKRILMYLYQTYMPLRAQWARYCVRKYRNFGIRVTSGTEASNNNVKGYLLNGMSHLYRLVEALQDMLVDQERDFTDACAQDEVLTAREYYGPSAEYLGELRFIASSKALRLITQERRKMLASIPTRQNPHPTQLGLCGEECSISIELGIPCCHTLYLKMEEGTVLSKWEIHHWWHLRDSSEGNPYQRILDPKIVQSRRGHPRNDAQALPQKLSFGNTTGRRASGQRLQPSIRRQRSQWEIMDPQPIVASGARSQRESIVIDPSIETLSTPVLHTPVEPVLEARFTVPSQLEAGPVLNAAKKQRGPPTCGRCGRVGHRRTNPACPGRHAAPTILPLSTELSLANTVANALANAAFNENAVQAAAQAAAASFALDTITATAAEAPAESPDKTQTAAKAAPLTNYTTDVMAETIIDTDGEVAGGNTTFKATLSQQQALSSPPPLPNLARYDSPEAIYQRYVDRRETWYRAQTCESLKTNHQYRKAMGLPVRYDKTDYVWCRSFKQMGKRYHDPNGSREWTEEEMTAYLDWDRAEDDRVEAQLIANPLNPGRRGLRDLWERIDEDDREQQDLYATSRS